MFSKEESKRIRQEFWISFGKSFPRKWILYNTKVKDLSFKFHFERKYARVSIDFEQSDLERRKELFEKFLSIKSILLEAIPDLHFEPSYILPNGKEIATIYVQIQGVSVHNKNSWQETMLFLKDTMEKLELVWWDFEDYIKS
ncbi:DUF4268 domain-containing protein [Aureisphaera galaxeae]|uniref:DUF4268 domain-containing protein n=1 Tax=Aureisphaera galaxeae TaxID=1538023 RepID=UPI002350690A|nr:DUF4268 domain-containing protein [Aureisphaera galaxeae]MDC8004414.1 DUF4268 domain-containing protein [Aureisphaera galaxeae]